MNQYECEDINSAAGFANGGLRAGRLEIKEMKHFTLSEEQKSALDL